MSKSSIIGYTTSNVSSLTDAECCCVSYIHDGLLRRPNGWWLLGLVGSRCLEQLTIVLILLVAPKKSQRRAASTCHQDGSRVSVFCNATKRWRERDDSCIHTFAYAHVEAAGSTSLSSSRTCKQSYRQYTHRRKPSSERHARTLAERSPSLPPVL